MENAQQYYLPCADAAEVLVELLAFCEFEKVLSHRVGCLVAKGDLEVLLWVSLIFLRSVALPSSCRSSV